MRNAIPSFSTIRKRRSIYCIFLLFYFLLPLSWCITELKRIWGTFSNCDEKKETCSILVIQLMKIGDLVCTTPVFRELRRRYPHAHITAIVLPLTAGVLENNPYVDEIIRYNSSVIEGSFRETYSFIKSLLLRQFTWSFIFSPNFRNIAYTCFAFIPHRICLRTPYCSRMTKAVYWTQTAIYDYDSKTSAAKTYLETLRGLGISQYAMNTEIYIDPADEVLVEHFFKMHHINSEDTIMALHPFAGIKMKEWGDEKFVSLAKRLVEQYHAKILLIGATSDRKRADRMKSQATSPMINSCGTFSLSQVAALLKRCQVFISVDTGPLYIANALGVPVIDIAGPCDLHTQTPIGVYEVVQKSLECAPCSFIMNAPRVCRRGNRKCLEVVSVDEVLEAFARLVPYWRMSEGVRKDARS